VDDNHDAAIKSSEKEKICQIVGSVLFDNDLMTEENWFPVNFLREMDETQLIGIFP
jgi:hypothetical protein